MELSCKWLNTAVRIKTEKKEESGALFWFWFGLSHSTTFKSTALVPLVVLEVLNTFVTTKLFSQDCVLIDPIIIYRLSTELCAW